ncbi:MAG: amidoligase family protein [Oceanospirillaceae bacterium]|nr:amidoligase family protein [Oceanospirillaceae bacterium]
MDQQFTPLPRETDAEGNPRLTGVEIEFSGLEAADVARLAVDCLGGAAAQTDDHAWQVTDTSIGKLDIYLDTALRHANSSPAKRIGLDIGKEVIPVEVVSEPLDIKGLSALDDLRAALRDAGAEGTRSGLVYGFGVHLNPSIAGRDAKGITYPLLAYALIESWMRDSHPIDFSRRVLPFTDPYPTRLVEALCEAGFVTPEAAMDIYLETTSSRNYGLDMLPIFAWMDQDRVTKAIGDDAVSARPAFHFRLPDCRIDEPGWSLRHEWARWRLVEQVAADEGLLARLMREWQEMHGSVVLRRAPWAERSGEMLEEAGLIDARDAA